MRGQRSQRVIKKRTRAIQPSLVPTVTVAAMQLDARRHDEPRWLAALPDADRRLAAIRDLLLPKLVTGQIDVSSLDLDALVERAAA